MAYKIQPLVESGYDFATLYPEKQESVRESTGLDFYLDSIVKFMQKQTNNFTIDNAIAHDLDDAIYKLVMKAGVPVEAPAAGAAAEPAVGIGGEASTDEKVDITIKAIEGLEILGDEEDKLDIEMLLEYVRENATSESAKEWLKEYDESHK